jgi:hypothetical protein
VIFRLGDDVTVNHWWRGVVEAVCRDRRGTEYHVALLDGNGRVRARRWFWADQVEAS